MKKRNLLIIIILLVITAVIAFFYLSGRKEAPKGCLAVVHDDKETLIDPFGGELTDVKGTTINGKGEEKEVSGSGITLLNALEMAKISTDNYTAVKVISSDEYAAELSAEEITAPGTAYLMKDTGDDGAQSIRLIVFGDTNSKRQVKNVVRIETVR